MEYVNKYTLLEILNNLMINHTIKNEEFQANAYNTAIEAIKKNSVIPFKDGSKILNKVKEIETTGTLSGYEQTLSNEKYELYKQFKTIYGIGEKKAIELALKLDNFNDVYSYADLNRVQKIGLQNINSRISKGDASIYFNKIALNIRQNNKGKILKFIPVGSFRRSNNDNDMLHDIDILIVDCSKNQNESLKNILNNEMFFKTFSFGEKKYSGLYKEAFINIRVDIMLTNKKEYPFALMHYTGPKEFNIYMSIQAKKQGLTLNEHGLSGIDCKSENDIFKVLRVPKKYRDFKLFNNVNDLDKILNETSKIQNREPELSEEDLMTIFNAIKSRVDRPKVEKAKVKVEKIEKPKVKKVTKSSKSTQTNWTKKQVATHLPHPPYKDMVLVAVKDYKNKNGSSRIAILRFIETHWSVHLDHYVRNRFVKQAIKSLVLEGKLKQMSGIGANGSFKYIPPK